ncbi:hypothetical protein QR680_016382 [Steinernema hermaphroditum]|uniref:Uncharacterized protein n=1 Tax=Steinernema hermaphroditum TaxID=289476 RepID=A0AA39HBD2_9BILA|nr:hypothetical protein QR680_016382 [Steinernema hermaphroditum]
MSGDLVNVFLYYSLSIFCVLLGIPFFYIVLTKSPPSLRVYRNTILNLAIWYFVAMTSFGLFLQPIYTTIDSKSCAKFVGLASFVGPRTDIAFLFLSVVACDNVAKALCICFFYRYAQLGRFNEPSSIRSYRITAMCVGLHVIGSILAGIFTYVLVLSSHFIEHDGLSHICFDDTNYYMVMRLSLIAGIAFAVASVTITIMGVMTITVLRSQKVHMTKQTYKIHLLLTLNLLFLVFLPVTFSGVPIFVCCYSVYVRSEYMYTTISVANHCPFFDLFSTCVVTLVFITPYRNSLKRMLCYGTESICPVVSRVATSMQQ